MGLLRIGLLGMLFYIISDIDAIVVIAHRGASGHIAENTLDAFEKAIELDSDMVELDVYCCATGQLVVFHDKLLDDKTNGTGFIEQQPLDKLKAYLVAGAYAIPTLQEVFDCIGRRVKIDIELKGADTAEPVAKLIGYYVANKGWSYNDFLVTSFDHYLLQEFNALLPDVSIGPIFSGLPIGYGNIIASIAADVVVLDRGMINEVMIDNAHQKGMQVFVFTVNRPVDIAEMKELGVDGIITDFPERV